MSDGVTLVVGTGPAGVAVAAGLLRRGGRVLLVEGGAERERQADRELNDGGDARGVWGHEPLGENRRRTVGGTSTAWGGRCVPLDPVDFEARDWVPHSGWPIAYDEYARWLPGAAELLEIPVTDFRRASSEALLARDAELDGTPIELWSPPTNTAHLLRDLERRHEHLRVLRETHVTAVRFAPDGSVSGLLARSADTETELVADAYVLATGALENARLLLAAGVGSRLPAVGRYYMSHVFATHVAYRGGPLPAATGFFRIGRTYARHRWQLTEEAQRSRGVGNVIGFVARPPAHGVSVHLDPLSALVGAAKLGRRHARSPRDLVAARGQFAVYARVLLKASPSFWPRIAVQSVRRRAKNRLPMLLPPRTAASHHLTVQAEHFPHPESRVVLSERVDRFGVPLLEADIDFHRADFDTVAAFHEAVSERLRRFGYRADRDGSTSVRELARDMVGGFNSNAHHIGTARMGADPATSVVDADCRVHGVPNLWIAGSAVFPTSGHANPTLSIVALACRLADHLAGR